jgi:hypothetical protein
VKKMHLHWLPVLVLLGRVMVDRTGKDFVGRLRHGNNIFPVHRPQETRIG